MIKKLYKCYWKGDHKKSVYNGVCLRCGGYGKGLVMYKSLKVMLGIGIGVNALFGTVTGVLVAFDKVDIVAVPELVTEKHIITEVKDNVIRGELTEGTGEGIYYTAYDFERAGLHNVKAGDIVEISWTEKDFNNEEWNNIYSLEKVEN